MYNHHFVRIGQIVKKAVGIIAFGQCAYRADGDTLSAIGTFAFRHHSVESGGYRRVKSAANSAECTDCLYVVTDTFATTAENTFIHIADNRSGDFPFARRKFTAIERHFANVETQC